MTQSKIAIAKRLAELRADGSDPETLARTLTVMKMHHEIEKILEAAEAAEEAPEPAKPVEPQAEPEFKPLIQSLFESFFGTDRE
jgi:hypothetical protein